MLFTQDHEGGVILQPSGLIPTPAVKGRMVAMRQLMPALSQLPGQNGDTLICEEKIQRGTGGLGAGEGGDIARLKESLLAEVMGIQQPGIDGKTGRRAVGRTCSIRWRQRQHLPKPNAVSRKRTDPQAGSSAKPPADRCIRQGGRMQQNADATTGQASSCHARLTV